MQFAFESSVNSEYSKTAGQVTNKELMFESSVNSEYSKTVKKCYALIASLRVV